MTIKENRCRNFIWQNNKRRKHQLSKADCQKIAETKMPDLNAASLEAAMSMIAGTARSMGITVEE